MLNRRRMTEQIAVRTRFFDDVFTNAARDGITQAVILASGLDTRAYRMSWPAGSVVFELDQPQVIEFKTRVMADLGSRRPPIAAPSRSTCAMTGRRHCGNTVSTSPSRRRGSPRAC